MAAPLQPAGVRAVAEGVDKYVGDMKRMGGATADMGSRLSQMATIAGGMIASQVFTRLGDAFMSVARGAMEFGKESVLTAARVQELDAVLLTIGKNAGIPKSELDELVESIKDLGIRTDVAQTLLVKFSRFQLNMADATKLARLAQDAAVISMQDSSEALDGLIHGITVMNTRVLRTYGITLASITDVQEKYAAEIGKTRDELTETEMIQAVLNGVLAQGSQIAGAYEAAMGTAGKQMRSMNRYVKELMLNIGTPFLGAFTSVIKAATSWIKYFQEITDEGTVFNRILKTIASVITKVFLKAMNRVWEVFEWTVHRVVALWEVIEAGQGIWGQLAHVFQIFMNRTRPLHEEILPRLLELFERYLLPVIEKVMKAFVFFAQAIALGTGPVHAMIEALSVLVPRDLVPTILKLHEKWDGFISSIREFLEKHKDNIVAGLKAIGLAITTYIITSKILTTIKILGLLLGALTNPIGLLLIAIGALGIAWSTNFGGIQDKLAEFWETTGKPIFEDIKAWLEEKIPEAIANVVYWFEEELPKAINEAIRWFQEDLPVALEELKEDFQPVIDKALELADAFIESGPTIQEELQKTSDFIRDTFIPSLISANEDALENTSTVLGMLASFWKEHGDTIIEIVGFWGRVLLGTIAGVMAFITNVVSAGLALLSGDWKGFWGSLKKAVEGFAGPILEALGTSLEEYRQVWLNNIDMLLEILAALPGRLYEIGKNIVIGLLEGLVDAWDSIPEWLTTALDNLVSTMSSFLRLYSPSGLFEDIGQNMMAGLAKGIQGAAQLPTMAAQVALSQHVMPAVAGVTRNQEFNLNVSTSAPSEPIIADFQMLALLAELS